VFSWQWFNTIAREKRDAESIAREGAWMALALVKALFEAFKIQC